MRRSNRFKKDPSKQEIRSRCAAIQAKWTERERLKRSGTSPRPWCPPILSKLGNSELHELDSERN